MPKRPTRSGSRSSRPAPAAAIPVLAALEALGFAFGRALRASAPAKPAPAAPKAPRRRRPLKAVAAKARAVAKAVTRTAAKAQKPRGEPKRGRVAADAEPKVVVAKPPVIRRKVVRPTRPATPSVNAPALDADAGPAPALDPGPALGPAPVRGDRVWFRQGDAVTEGELIRVTLDGSLVVALTTGDRVLVSVADLVPQPQP